MSAGSAESSRAIADRQGVKCAAVWPASRCLGSSLPEGVWAAPPRLGFCPFLSPGLSSCSFLPVGSSRLGPTSAGMGRRWLLLHSPAAGACGEEPGCSPPLGSPRHRARVEARWRPAGWRGGPAMPVHVCAHGTPQHRCHRAVRAQVPLGESSGACAAPGGDSGQVLPLPRERRGTPRAGQPHILLSIKQKSREIRKALGLLSTCKLVRLLLVSCCHLKSCPSAA